MFDVGGGTGGGEVFFSHTHFPGFKRRSIENRSDHQAKLKAKVKANRVESHTIGEGRGEGRVGAIAIDQNNPLFDDQKRGRGGKTNPTVSRSQPTDTHSREVALMETQRHRERERCVCERERPHENWKLEIGFGFYQIDDRCGCSLLPPPENMK